VPQESVSELAKQLEAQLFKKYNMLMLSGESLRQALGYPSQDALRQAIKRSYVEVPLFTLPNRRGYFALVKDIALWIAQCQQQRRCNTKKK
jgi:adenylylsulfate kinase-like enzyme